MMVGADSADIAVIGRVIAHDKDDAGPNSQIIYSLRQTSIYPSIYIYFICTYIFTLSIYISYQAIYLLRQYTPIYISIHTSIISIYYVCTKIYIFIYSLSFYLSIVYLYLQHMKGRFAYQRYFNFQNNKFNRTGNKYLSMEKTAILLICYKGIHTHTLTYNKFMSFRESSEFFSIDSTSGEILTRKRLENLRYEK